MESKGQIQGLLCAMPVGTQQCPAHPRGWQQAGKGAIPVETKCFLLTCLFTTTFVPGFPASSSTLHIPGIVTPIWLAKGKEVEVSVYLFSKVPPCFKPIF